MGRPSLGEEHRRARQRKWEKDDPARRAKIVREYRKRDPRSQMLSNAKARSKSQGVPFAITRDDIRIPQVCPILGIPLCTMQERGGRSDGSPSLDKIIPELGYVPGNVRVISMRANRLKNNATPQELLALALYANPELETLAKEIWQAPPSIGGSRLKAGRAVPACSEV